MDSLGGRNLNGVQLHGKTGVAVGQGGLVLTTEAAGSSWNFAELGLAKNVAYDWDFRAVHGAGKQYWVVGRPGSVVLHSGDDGAHWEVQQTGQPLPLDAVYFADEQHGWAVGELGSVLATTDGGKSWQVQRRGGQRSAALFVHARAAGTPLDTIALVGGQDGYLTDQSARDRPRPGGSGARRGRPTPCAMARPCVRRAAPRRKCSGNSPSPRTSLTPTATTCFRRGIACTPATPPSRCCGKWYWPCASGGRT